MSSACQLPNGGSAPASPGFNAVAPERLASGAADAAPDVLAAESTLGSHPCVALSSAQVLPGWTTSTPPCNDFSSNGNYPLNFVSHFRGSLHCGGAGRKRGGRAEALLHGTLRHKGGLSRRRGLSELGCGGWVEFGHTTGLGGQVFTELGRPNHILIGGSCGFRVWTRAGGGGQRT